MHHSKLLANRFREVMLDGTRIAGTNVKKQLDDVSFQLATSKVDSLDTIASLTFHIDYYIDGIIHVFEGGSLDIRDALSFEMKPLMNESDWQNLREKINRDSEKFAFHVESMSEENLNAPFVDARYGTYARNIDAMIEHAYYHLGQISLIKKLLLQKNGTL